MTATDPATTGTSHCAECQSSHLARPLAAWRAAVLLALPLAVHLLTVRPAEPVFDGDSNRHMMTSVFFRDFLADGQYTDPKAYAEAYYEQYPALGLLVWPPLFHGITGLLMLVLGTGVGVGRAVVFAFFLLACGCVWRLTVRAAGRDTALAATALFSVMPLIFDYSRDVMLEIPTLAFVLLAAELFDVWLTQHRTRNLYFAAAAAAAAALTRFDAAVLLPYVVFRIALGGHWKRVANLHVVMAAFLTLLTIAPVYFVIAREVGSLHLTQAVTSVGGSEDGSANGWMSAKNFAYYPTALVTQCGWPAAILCGVGFVLSLSPARRRSSATLLALFLATYVTFTPLAELRARHAIYWVPSAAFFAVQAVSIGLTLARAAQRRGPAGWIRIALSAAAYGLLLASTAVAAMNQRNYRVSGYAATARLAIDRTRPGDRVFFDGWWDGNFTYHLRHLDPTRSRRVIRGDRLLYDFVCIPDTGFQTFADNNRRMVELLLEADPRLIIIENPQFYRVIPVAQRLRELIAAHPEVFVPLQDIPVESSLTHLPKFRLEVFRFQPDAARHWLERHPPVESAAHSIPTRFVTDRSGEMP